MGSSLNTRRQISAMAKKHNTNSDLVQELSDWFGQEETSKILTMKKSDLKTTARVNLMKRTRPQALHFLRKEGIIASEIPEVPEGITITKGFEKLGYSKAYLSGEVMAQGLGSMLAVHALEPLPGDRILDLAAAPGGKSCFIGERMKGEGTLIVNDVSVKRISSLINNLSRHGISNVNFLNEDAAKVSISPVDKIMLDAPCSGDGLLVSQDNRRRSKSVMNSYGLQKTQISILRHASSLLKLDGVCIYSTCALTPIENEMVLNQVKNKFEIEKMNIPGDEGVISLNKEFEKVRRLLPSKFACDGFFIAKLRKIGP